MAANTRAKAKSAKGKRALGNTKGRGSGRKGRGKGKTNALMLAIEDAQLPPKQKARATQLLAQKEWLKDSSSCANQMVKEIEDVSVIQKKIDTNTQCIGTKILGEWQKAKKALKLAKDKLKGFTQQAEGQDPAWFAATKQQKGLTDAQDAYKKFKEAKDNCLKSIRMGK